MNEQDSNNQAKKEADDQIQDNVIGKFMNQAQEDAQFLRKQIFVQTKPSYQHESEPNPNASSRLVGKIFQSYNEMVKGVYNMMAYLRNYKMNLYVHNQKTRIELRLKNRPQEVSQQQRMAYERLKNEELPMVLFKISLVSSDEDKNAIKNCINKLKVMIVKALYAESSNLQYLIDSYTTNLKNCLNKHQLRYKFEQKTNEHRLLQLLFSRTQFIQTAFESIKQQFDVITLKQLKLCKIAPHVYLSQLRKERIRQKPIFFINFYTQSLLFVQNQYTKFDQILLYCPLVSIDTTILLSEFYLRRLNQTCLQWASQILLIEIYHEQTSSEVPLFFSHIKRTQLPISQANEMSRMDYQNQRLRKQFVSLSQLIKKVYTIQRFIFSQLLFSWLQKLFGGSQFSPIQIVICRKFKVVIKMISEDFTYSTKERLPKERTQILANLLTLAANKKNPSESKQGLKEKVYNTLQASLLRVVAQKMGARVSWPVINGSMGHYYYNYDFTKENKENVLSRGQVSQFLNKF